MEEKKNSKKTLFYALVIIAFLVFLVLFQKKGNETETPEKESFPLGEIFKSPEGEPVFASGNCNEDTDCMQTGCSAHICANHEIITTCEVVTKPQDLGYSCVCSNNLCVWQQKFDQVESSE